MKKQSSRLLVIAMLMCLVIMCVFSSCQSSNPSNDDQSQGDLETNGETHAPLSDSCKAHSFDDGVVTKKATCSEKGVKKQTCKLCGSTQEVYIPTLAHDFDEGVVTLNPTLNSKGKTLYTCKTCGATEEKEDIEMLPCAYIITMDSIGELRLPEDGVYQLEAPTKVGYNFVKWIDANGNDFPASGTVKKNITVTAVWEIADTTTVEELEERAAAGVDNIRLVGDIVIDRPIFFTGETNLYAVGNVKLIRKPTYAGDMFVVGQDKEGTPSVLLGKQAVLTIGGEGGSIKIDGNKSALETTVVGSAIFVSDSATVNIKDGTTISNHKKLGNERALTYNKDRAGGAAIAIINGTVKMYGGLIENNLVVTEYTKVTNEDGSESSAEIACCGGAIFNNGTFYMYGGTITANEALRGGAIYTHSVVYLEAGTISYNTAHSFGGAVSSSSYSAANTYIGTEGSTASKINFNNNRCTSNGGALYSATNSPIVILGNAEFSNNEADGSGGAIYASSGLTIRDTTFSGNSCAGSGGSIYYCYNADDGRSPRIMELTRCTFDGNEAKLGGAVILSASDSVFETGKGAIANITGCTFTNNNTYEEGAGGAVYVTRQSTASIKSSVFTGNSAHHGGALYISGSTVEVSENNRFAQNTATEFGGAVYISEHVRSVKNAQDETETTYTPANVTINNATFEENEGGRGGALYVAKKSRYTLAKVVFSDNTATEEEYGGGAIYSTDSTGTLDAITLTNNTSHKGGAIALHSTSSMTISSMTATGNSATANTAGKLGIGGVFYVNNSTLTIAKDGDLGIVIGGTADTAVNSAVGGGAIYAENSAKITISDASFIGNLSTTTGGAIHAANATLSISDVNFENNSSTNNGGAVYVARSSLSCADSTFKNNTSGNHGGAIDLVATEATVTDCDFEENTASNHGGAIYVVYATENNEKIESTLNMTGGTFQSNTAMAGGAVSIRTDCEASFDGTTFKNNTVSGFVATESNKADGDGEGGGAIYVGYGSLDLKDCAFTENNSSYGYGGAINACQAPVSIQNGTFTGNTSLVYGGAISATKSSGVTVTGTTFTSNKVGNTDTEANGGAIYISTGLLTVDGTAFTSNSATSEGGAIYLAKATFACNNSTFSLNEATNGGAVAIGSSSDADFAGATFTQNKATLGGAVYAYSSTVACSDSTFKKNASTNHAGALYLNSTEATLTGYNLFDENTAVNHGGAVYVTYITVDDEKIGGTLNMTGGEFKNNSAQNGGAVSGRTNSTLIFSGVNFTQNKATCANDNNSSNGGGAIYINTGSLTITGGVFDGNTSGNYGGAITATDSATIEMTGGAFKNNTAKNGGAVSGRTACMLTFSDVDFIANKATLGYSDVYNAGGGAIFTYAGALTVTGGTFDGNTSGYYGGAISTDGTTVNISDGTVVCNNSGTTGGALYFKGGSNVTMDTVTIENNKATTGVVYFNTGSNQLTNITATGNTATNGGVFYISGGTVTVSDSTFSNNFATTSGSVFRISSSAKVTVKNSELKNNGKKINPETQVVEDYTNMGGAVYVEGNNNLVLEECTVTNNGAELGGGIYAKAVTYTATSCTIADNFSATAGAENEYTAAA